MEIKVFFKITFTSFVLVFFVLVEFKESFGATFGEKDIFCKTELELKSNQDKEIDLIQKELREILWLLATLRLDLNHDRRLEPFYVLQLEQVKKLFLDHGVDEVKFNTLLVSVVQEIRKLKEDSKSISNSELAKRQSIQEAQSKKIKNPLEGRTPQVVQAIVKLLHKPASEIEWKDLASITHLSLDGSGEKDKLTTLNEDDFLGLINLTSLSLSNNHLTHLPPHVFEELVSLKSLYIENNRLEYFEENVFDSLINLEHLYLNYNRLTVLPEKLFQNLKKLTRLMLYYNQLIDLPDKLFSTNLDLVILLIGKNKLKSLSPDLLKGLAKLLILDINSNFLEELPIDLLNDCTSLETLYIYANPFKVLPDVLFEKPPSLMVVEIYNGNRSNEILMQIDVLRKKYPTIIFN